MESKKAGGWSQIVLRDLLLQPWRWNRRVDVRFLKATVRYKFPHSKDYF